MNQSEKIPRFNLWYEPWITVETVEGATEEVSILEALCNAHAYRGLAEPSPLVVVGIHRLLTAVLQDIHDPQTPTELQELCRAESFDEKRLTAFGEAFADSFDLFSEKAPFYQSADLPLAPTKGDKAATSIAPELPKGGEITHFHHGAEEEGFLCPACCAGGLLHLSVFATAGGAGIKPSINGVPPIYVLPMGKTLLQSLMRSLVIPQFQPTARDDAKRDYWWRREPLVGKKDELKTVGYGGSLTFVPRRMRLHPLVAHEPCTRCGRSMIWGVRTMVFEMGESLAKDSPFWFDPFASYRLRDEKTPLPVRPRDGRALWRDFGELFLADEEKTVTYRRPSVITQLTELELVRSRDVAYRCIGMRTDMKAKIFEWVDDGFEVPLAVLSGKRGTRAVKADLGYAEDVGSALGKAWRNAFRERSDARLEAVRARMLSSYWQNLAIPFRQMVTQAAQVSGAENEKILIESWQKQVVRAARWELDSALEGLSTDAETLRRRVAAQDNLVFELAKINKRQGGNE